MYFRLVILTHLVPSISRWNIWNLPWAEWLAYATFVDQWMQQQRKGVPGVQ